jgi:chemotaxis protein methyltransferase CheR
MRFGHHILNEELDWPNFSRLARIIEDHAGIRTPPSKKSMVEGRLRRRVRALGLRSLGEYCAKLFEEGWLEAELRGLINVITTNKTDFLREPEHFRLLAQKYLPELTRAVHMPRPGFDRPFRVWSAAASTGAEAYTLAMVLDQFARQQRGFRFDILATDISTTVLETARLAIYPEDMIEPVPLPWRTLYFLRSVDSDPPVIRMRPEIRESVRFGYLNLMDPVYPVDDAMDVIFCRNVLIYFDKATQQDVLRKLCEHLRPDGLLFISHTETVAGMDLPVRQVAPSVFQRK